MENGIFRNMVFWCYPNTDPRPNELYEEDIYAIDSQYMLLTIDMYRWTKTLESSVTVSRDGILQICGANDRCRAIIGRSVPAQVDGL
jgi:hypothetical protein